jgi:DNA transformation protein
MSQYTDFLIELFDQFGRVSARRMFGGHGIFHDGLMIGLVADDVLYLKADKELAPKFEALDLPPFTYDKAGKLMQMSYFQAPESIFDDPALACEWARDSYQAALRSRPKKPVRKAPASKKAIKKAK